MKWSQILFRTWQHSQLGTECDSPSFNHGVSKPLVWSMQLPISFLTYPGDLFPGSCWVSSQLRCSTTILPGLKLISNGAICHFLSPQHTQNFPVVFMLEGVMHFTSHCLIATTCIIYTGVNYRPVNEMVFGRCDNNNNIYFLQLKYFMK